MHWCGGPIITLIGKDTNPSVLMSPSEIHFFQFGGTFFRFRSTKNSSKREKSVKNEQKKKEGNGQLQMKIDVVCTSQEVSQGSPFCQLLPRLEFLRRARARACVWRSSLCFGLTRCSNVLV